MRGVEGRARASAVAVALAVAGCTETLPDPALQARLGDYFAAQGVSADALRCAGALERVAGSSIACTAWVDDERVELVVSIDDPDAPPVVRPRQPTLITAQIEPEIAQALRAQGRVVSRVRCEGRLWVVAPGVEHRCAIEGEGGERLAWIGTFTGEGSSHRARVVPWPDAGPQEAAP